MIFIRDLGMRQSGKGRKRFWEVQCGKCGDIGEYYYYHIKNGSTRSCSSCSSEKRTSHNMSKTSEYRTWNHMIQRCENKNNDAFHYYGGRGIKVCDEWHSFKNFIENMGIKPTSKHSIDRINHNGNYEPSNCIWATQTEQCNNMRMLSTNKTSYRGVSWSKTNKCYVVEVMYKGKRYRERGFLNPVSAALAYDRICVVNDMPKHLNFKQGVHYVN